MAKSRRNRARKAQGSDFVEKKAPKPLSDPELLAFREQHILPALNDLKEADPKLRLKAAESIRQICQDEKGHKLLLREQIIHVVLTETLTDPSPESQVAGWSILGELDMRADDGFHVHLFRAGVIPNMESTSSRVTSHNLSFS